MALVEHGHVESKPVGDVGKEVKRTVGRGEERAHILEIVIDLTVGDILEPGRGGLEEEAGIHACRGKEAIGALQHMEELMGRGDMEGVDSLGLIASAAEAIVNDDIAGVALAVGALDGILIARLSVGRKTHDVDIQLRSVDAIVRGWWCKAHGMDEEIVDIVKGAAGLGDEIRGGRV
ncbi:MAG: hypothetical protein BWY77_01611 [bacterium ADurb.Bin431]|nr:MAG: hypothetical protein BWY77_01611 [bacterium ADurb.Bin431]